jgi:hypothetical protein
LQQAATRKTLRPRLKKLVGLEPERRRSMEKQAVQATKGNQDFYGEGKV